MMWNVVRIGLWRLRHGRMDVLLTFGAPIAFFTIFALIFDAQLGSANTPRVGVALVDEDLTSSSRHLVALLAEHPSLRVRPPEAESGRAGPAVFRKVDRARELVLRGGISLAIVVPEGWEQSLTGPTTTITPVRIVADTSDPLAPQIVSALVQQMSGRVAADRLAHDAVGFPLPPELTEAIAARLGGPGTVELVDLLSAEKANPIVSMYAAGIAVMFLLFGAIGGGGSLLDEEASQTLERILCSPVTMTQLLGGKWLLITIVGTAQVTVMFLWAQLVFGVDLTGHVASFGVMTVVTAAAASSLALALAAACRSRPQLNAVAIVLVLCMSALGGSMVPRFAMSETMQEVGKLTFNAWALDGYTKIFWRDLPLTDLAPELGVLTASTLALLSVARWLARRWEHC